MKKRLIASVLALVMCLSMLPATALAAGSSAVFSGTVYDMGFDFENLVKPGYLSGLKNVTVTLTDANGTEVGSVTTDETGEFSIPVTPGVPYQLTLSHYYMSMRKVTLEIPDSYDYSQSLTCAVSTKFVLGFANTPNYTELSEILPIPYVVMRGNDDFSAELEKPPAPEPAKWLSVTVDAPSVVRIGDENPFKISVHASNLSKQSFSNVAVTLDLSQSNGEDDSNLLTLDLIGDIDGIAVLEEIPPGGSVDVIWPVLGDVGEDIKTAVFTIRITENDEPIYEKEFTVTLGGEYYTVTFDPNGGNGEITQQVRKGECAQEPEKPPTRTGQVLNGWYTDARCTTAWDFTQPITQDVTLYAGWVSNKLDFKVDTFNFNNTRSDFASTNYLIRKDYMDILTGVEKDKLTWAEGIVAFLFGYQTEAGKRLNDKQLENWDGSCFGMSAVLALVKAGKLDVEFFQKDATCLYDLDAPKDNDTVASLINYYYLMQYSKITARAKDVSNPNKSVIDALKSSKYPVLIGFNIYEFSSEQDWKNGVLDDEIEPNGHAIIAYDYIMDTNGDYLVKIWDPTYSTSYPKDDNLYNNLRISADFSSAAFENCLAIYDGKDTQQIWRKTAIKYAFTVESGVYDIPNLQTALNALGYTTGYQSKTRMLQAQAQVEEEVFYTLYTNYPSFTITSSNGMSAEIVMGQKISGDLDVSDGIFLNAMDYDCQMELNIYSFEEGDTLELTPAPAKDASGQPLTQYSTILMTYADIDDGFYAGVDAAGTGTLRYAWDGTVTTDFDAAIEQSVNVVRNDAATPWYSVTASGATAGMTVSPSSTQTAVSCVDTAQITVIVEDTYNEAVLEPVTVDASGIQIAQGDGQEAVVTTADGAVLASGTMDHTVIFYTFSGSAVAAQHGIRTGGTVEKPADPVCAGYTFGGWYTSPDYTETWDFSAPVTEDLRLFARWIADEENPFTDVAESDWYYDAVMYNYLRGLMTGTSDTTFSPLDHMTRAMLVTVIYRMEGEPETEGTTTFADVETGTWYSDAVAWAADNDIVNGYSKTQFGTNDDVTREQIAAILYRYAAQKGYDISKTGELSGFDDAEQISEYALDAIRWAVGCGLMQGSGGRLNSGVPATRAEVATFLNRFLDMFQ